MSDDHDKVIEVSTTQDLMCKKLDYIIDKVDTGFQKNEEAHIEMIKDSGKKPTWTHVISIVGLMIILFSILFSNHITDIKDVRAEINKSQKQVVEMIEVNK